MLYIKQGFPNKHNNIYIDSIKRKIEPKSSQFSQRRLKTSPERPFLSPTMDKILRKYQTLNIRQSEKQPMECRFPPLKDSPVREDERKRWSQIEKEEYNLVKQQITVGKSKKIPTIQQLFEAPRFQSYRYRHHQVVAPLKGKSASEGVLDGPYQESQQKQKIIIPQEQLRLPFSRSCLQIAQNQHILIGGKFDPGKKYGSQNLRIIGHFLQQAIETIPDEDAGAQIRRFSCEPKKNAYNKLRKHRFPNNSLEVGARRHKVSLLISLSSIIDTVINQTMDRGIPSFNRIIIEKMQHRNMQTHYQKLFSIHHSKRTRTEASPGSIGKANPKKELQLEEKSTEIDKSNVLLFQKMNKIMHRADPLNSKTNHLKINSRRFASHIQRVNEENQQFLQRLCRLKPTIDNKKFVEQRKKQIAILKSLGRNSYHGRGEKEKYEFVSHSKRSQPSQKEQLGQSRTKRNLEESVSLGKISASYMLPLNPRPRYTEGDYNAGDNELKESQMYFKREMEKIEERRKKIQSSISEYQQKQIRQIQSKYEQKSQRFLAKQSILLNKSITLFATFKKMEDGRIYKVQILRKHRLYEIACIQVDSLDRRLVLSMDEADGNELLSSIDYDYQSLIDSLQVDNANLSINRQKLQSSGRHVEQALPGAPKMRIKNQSYKNPSHITEQSIEQQQSVLEFPESGYLNAQFFHTLYNK